MKMKRREDKRRKALYKARKREASLLRKLRRKRR
jgi:hypothetical protein